MSAEFCRWLRAGGSAFVLQADGRLLHRSGPAGKHELVRDGVSFDEATALVAERGGYRQLGGGPNRKPLRVVPESKPRPRLKLGESWTDLTPEQQLVQDWRIAREQQRVAAELARLGLAPAPTEGEDMAARRKRWLVVGYKAGNPCGIGLDGKNDQAAAEVQARAFAQHLEGYERIRVEQEAVGTGDRTVVLDLTPGQPLPEAPAPEVLRVRPAPARSVIPGFEHLTAYLPDAIKERPSMSESNGTTKAPPATDRIAALKAADERRKAAPSPKEKPWDEMSRHERAAAVRELVQEMGPTAKPDNVRAAAKARGWELGTDSAYYSARRELGFAKPHTAKPDDVPDPKPAKAKAAAPKPRPVQAPAPPPVPQAAAPAGGVIEIAALKDFLAIVRRVGGKDVAAELLEVM